MYTVVVSPYFVFNILHLICPTSSKSALACVILTFKSWKTPTHSACALARTHTHTHSLSLSHTQTHMSSSDTLTVTCCAKNKCKNNSYQLKGLWCNICTLHLNTEWNSLALTLLSLVDDHLPGSIVKSVIFRRFSHRYSHVCIRVIVHWLNWYWAKPKLFPSSLSPSSETSTLKFRLKCVAVSVGHITCQGRYYCDVVAIMGRHDRKCRRSVTSKV